MTHNGKGGNTLLKNRTGLILLALAGLIVIGAVAYFAFFNQSGCTDCPTFKYFRLDT